MERVLRLQGRALALVTLLVDTSVWSLLLRRDIPQEGPHVEALTRALEGGDLVATTGIILQELLQGALPDRVRDEVSKRLSSLTYLEPTRDDHIAAADLRNTLRSAGVQLGTIDALIAQLAIGRSLTLLSADRDFESAARHVPLRLWEPSAISPD
jgi:predicted nucleic acid-binding protein